METCNVFRDCECTKNCLQFVFQIAQASNETQFGLDCNLIPSDSVTLKMNLFLVRIIWCYYEELGTTFDGSYMIG